MAIPAAQMRTLTGPDGGYAGLSPDGSGYQSAATSPSLDVVNRGGCAVWRCCSGGACIEGPEAPAVCAALSARQ